jgi:arylamine N-acetyltransferase
VNNSRENHSIISDPSLYAEAASFFDKHFSVSHSSTGLGLMEEILFYFSRLPYENISKIIKYHSHFDGEEKIRLPREIMDDHVRHRLGGTCFSLTFFLQTLLHSHGFSCYPVMADMRWGKNVHCAVIVDFESKKYLLDPGYLLNHPMEISLNKPRYYKTEFSGIELLFHPESGRMDLYTFDRHQKKWRYRFWDRPVSPEEFLDHWLSSFRWNSMHGLCLTKVEKDRMIYIHKTFMRETKFDEKRNFNIKKNYHASIRRIFGIAPLLVEEALAAVESNMTRERELGLWVPNASQNLKE